MGGALIHVAAAAIVDESAGRVLLARRPEDKHQGGFWEFPGGKVEPGEAVEAALARELHEELGIKPVVARPLIRVTHHYPGRSVLLDVWRVTAFTGTPHGREGQPVEWVPIKALPGRDFPAANRPIVQAVSLPDRYLITPDPGAFADRDAFLCGLDAALARGVRLVQLRSGAEPDPELAAACVARAHGRGARILLNGNPARALALGFDGVHLNARRLTAQVARPLPPEWLVGASCHDARELAQAAAVGADFALLSPVAATPSHPDAVPLGWERFHALADAALLPVFALGGVGEVDLGTAWRAGAQGIAAIRDLWGAIQGKAH